MTEEEAKAKVCPVLAGGNGMAYCQGSRCMAWRWAEYPNPEWKPERYSLMQQWPPRDSRFDPPMMVCHETEGYCGLAGRAGALQEPTAARSSEDK